MPAAVTIRETITICHGWRIENRAEIEVLAVALRSMADVRAKRNESGAEYYHTIADRVLAGILEAVEP